MKKVITEENFYSKEYQEYLYKLSKEEKNITKTIDELEIMEDN